MNFKIRILVKLILITTIAMGINNCTTQKQDSISQIEFDVKNVPFSFPKSYFSVSNSKQKNGVSLSDLRYADFGQNNNVFLIRYTINSDTINPNAIGTPAEMPLTYEGKKLGKACFESEKIIRLIGEDATMLLVLDSNLIANKRLLITKKRDNQYYIQNNNTFGTSRHIITCLNGSIIYMENQHLFVVKPLKDKHYDICVEEVDSIWTAASENEKFEDCVDAAQNSFNNFLSQMPTLPQKYNKARSLASYILWSCMIDKGGNYKRPGMLMSKNWMHYIWSWDHCFNSMACSYEMPEMAWNNYITMFDAQDSTGQLPDLIGYSRIITDYLKPPIHGWTLKKLIDKNELSESQLIYAYSSLKKWTNFWFNQRDINKNGIPEYTHGNDSGWDNGTEFDVNDKPHIRANRESASLPAYLILQMDVLRDLAIRLEYNDDAKQWKERSDNLLSLMVSEMWDGNKFVTTNLDDNNSINDKSQSLMAFLPIVLGNKLPQEIRSKLINGLKNDGYITKWGLATESINSPLYSDDGYWSGPIWAPSTMIIIDGLNKSGEHELAKDIAESFCNLCAKSGFAENFDAKTGDGLRDQAYTWTASVFLILGHEYLEE